MKKMKVVRVTKEEYELEDGTICPMMFDLDTVPSVEEFQEIYDSNFDLVKDLSEGKKYKKVVK